MIMRILIAVIIQIKKIKNRGTNHVKAIGAAF